LADSYDVQSGNGTALFLQHLGPHRVMYMGRAQRLVGWSLTSLFSTNTAISEMTGQGWRVILLPSKGRPAMH